MRGVVDAINRQALRGTLFGLEAAARPPRIDVLWRDQVAATCTPQPPQSTRSAFTVDLPQIEGFTPLAAATALRVRVVPADGGAPQDLPVADTLATLFGWRLGPSPPTGRIAYLFLCANAPQVLGRALTLLRHAADGLFAHVDTKINQAPFEAAAAGSGARFVTERIDVQWGTFSMIEVSSRLGKLLSR